MPPSALSTLVLFQLRDQLAQLFDFRFEFFDAVVVVTSTRFARPGAILTTVAASFAIGIPSVATTTRTEAAPSVAVASVACAVPRKDAPAAPAPVTTIRECFGKSADSTLAHAETAPRSSVAAVECKRSVVPESSAVECHHSTTSAAATIEARSPAPPCTAAVNAHASVSLLAEGVSAAAIGIAAASALGIRAAFSHLAGARRKLFERQRSVAVFVHALEERLGVWPAALAAPLNSRRIAATPHSAKDTEASHPAAPSPASFLRLPLILIRSLLFGGFVVLLFRTRGRGLGLRGLGLRLVVCLGLGVLFRVGILRDQNGRRRLG
ncbi:MAG: hypothetical protein WD648_11725 [Planctomycetaceae bacterium]